MRSTFSRLFLSATLILVLALLLVGVSFQLLLRDHVEDTITESLQQDAVTFSAMASAYASESALTDEAFRVNLSLSTRLTGHDVVICNSQGRILLCSDEPLGCAHQGLQIASQQDLQKLLHQGGAVDTGMISGLYSEPRHVVTQPILDQDGTPLGIVLVSTPTTSFQPVIGRISNSYLTVSVLAIAVSLCFIVLMARLQAKPLRRLSQAAHDFGHGHLDARVPLEDVTSQEMRELALSFNNMASSLQKSEYQRQEFVANISHELKTPMTAISGYVDGILDGTIPPERQEHYMRLVSEETKRLSRLVRSMLEISQLQNQGQIPEERKLRFDVCELAGQVLLRFERQALDKALQVQVRLPEHPLYTRADQDAITQVIYNLLDNAVKFCERGKTLTLQLRNSDDKIFVCVGNEGPTIPPQELPLVFDRFHKIDKSRSKNQDGWGLGLYIVKTLVNGHGENISVSSKNGYTEFSFTLPLVT